MRPLILAFEKSADCVFRRTGLLHWMAAAAAAASLHTPMTVTVFNETALDLNHCHASTGDKDEGIGFNITVAAIRETKASQDNRFITKLLLQSRGDKLLRLGLSPLGHLHPRCARYVLRSRCNRRLLSVTQ